MEFNVTSYNDRGDIVMMPPLSLYDAWVSILFFDNMAIFFANRVIIVRGFPFSHHSPNFIVFAGWMCDTRKLGTTSTNVQMVNVPAFSSRMVGMLSSTGTSET